MMMTSCILPGAGTFRRHRRQPYGLMLTIDGWSDCYRIAVRTPAGVTGIAFIEHKKLANLGTGVVDALLEGVRQALQVTECRRFSVSRIAKGRLRR